MNLQKVTNYQKSRAILSVMSDYDWKTFVNHFPDGRIGDFHITIDKMFEFDLKPPHYLYDERAMCVMWRILTWMEYKHRHGTGINEAVITDEIMAKILTSRPQVVQMLLLDRILCLLIDAGMLDKLPEEETGQCNLHTKDYTYTWHNWGSDGVQAWYRDYG